MARQAQKTLAELLAGFDYLTGQGDLGLPVSGIAYHSGRVKPGEVFVAIRGFQTDGHRYLTQAWEQGAIALVVEDELAVPPGAVYVKVADSRRALAHLAARFYEHPSRELTVIGITGTNGKTTTTYLLEAIWRAWGKRVGVIGTVNWRFDGKIVPAATTTPESLDLQQLLAEMRSGRVDCALMEVSSHALSLDRAHGVEFAAAIFTNLTQDHLDFHGDMKTYFAAKRRLFVELLPARSGEPGLAVVNLDDPWGRRLAAAVQRPYLTYGFDPRCDLHPAAYRLTKTGITADLETPWGRLALETPLLGRYNLYNILGATAAALGLGVEPAAVAAGLARITGVDGRLEPVTVPGQPLVLVDYAHTPDALEQVLKTLQDLDFDRIITVFGCGGDRDRGKRPLMGQVAATGSTVVVVTSDNPRTEDPLAIIADIEAGLREISWPQLTPEEAAAGARGYLVVPDRRQAIRTAVALARPEDVVLLAGKGHETYQILGTTRIHFDDRLEALQALRARARQQQATVS